MIKIIISPAKKMICDPDSLECKGMPKFLNKTENIKNKMQSMTYSELKKLWGCNENIAKLNFERLEDMNLERNITPAILSYDGIRFKYMAPNVFDYTQLDYIQNHLVILSGFYGALRPFDGVVPYRLEMQAKLNIDNCKNLYEYWKDDIYKFIANDNDTIINLASNEYSKTISKYLSKENKMINCVFGDMIEGKIIEKGTKCKMARGEMVRFMAENLIETPEEIKKFNRLGYIYSKEHSTETEYIFLQKKIKI